MAIRTFTYPSSALTLNSESATGAAVPSDALFVGGTDGTNLRGLAVDTTGKLNINNISGTVSLPTGASTAAKQDSEIALLTTMDADTGAIATSVASVDSKLPSNLTVTSTRLLVDPSGVTSPVSVASLPLPTGAATAALQSSAIGYLVNIDTATDAGATSAASIDGKITACNTGAVVVSSSALPTGAATAALQTQPGVDIGDVTINNASGASAVNIQDGGNSITVDGTVAATQSGTWTVQPGNTANTTAWLVDQAGRAKADTSSYNDYSSTSVTTSAYVQLEASLAAACKEIEIFDSSGQGMILAVGAAASEVDQIYIFPGGNGRVPLAIAASSRISIKAKTATASSGYIMINYYT